MPGKHFHVARLPFQPARLDLDRRLGSVAVLLTQDATFCRRICIAARGCPTRAASSEPHVFWVPSRYMAGELACGWLDGYGRVRLDVVAAVRAVVGDLAGVEVGDVANNARIPGGEQELRKGAVSGLVGTECLDQ